MTEATQEQTKKAIALDVKEKDTYAERGKEHLQKAQRLKIAGEKSLQNADKWVTDLAKEVKSFEAFMAPHIKRAHEAHKALTSDRNRILAPFKEALGLVNGKIRAHVKMLEEEAKKKAAQEEKKRKEQEEKDRKAEEERLLKEAERLDDAGFKEEATDALEKATTIEAHGCAPMSPIPAPRRGFVKPKLNTTIVESFKGEVENFALLPDEYKTVDQSKLDGVIKKFKGKIVIPGVKIVDASYTQNKAK